MAPPASATAATATVTAESQPTIYPSNTGQPGGDWTITTSGEVINVGQQFNITVDDNNADINCAITGDTLGFSGTPTVTVTSPTTGAPTFNVSTTSSGAGCLTAGIKNTLVLRATTSGVVNSLTISGVLYDVGPGVDPGPITVSYTGTTAVAAPVATNITPAGPFGDSNAIISPIKVTANTPPTGVKPGTSGAPISNLTIQEFQPTVFGQGPDNDWVCIEITAPGNPGDITFGGTPTVSASGGGAQAANIQKSDDGTNPATSQVITFQVTNTSTATPATWTVGGLVINTPNPDLSGPVTADVTTGADRASACGGTPVATDVVITSIIGVDRIAGSNRFATARALGEDEFGCADIAILARGDVFADALAGSYLAGWYYAPILLSGNTSVPSDTVQALREMGVDSVVLLGQTAALAQSVANQLAATPRYDCGGGTQVTEGGITQNIQVTRIGGADRFETAKLVAEEPGLDQGGTADYDGDAFPTPKKTAIVASGVNFPDALSAAPMAFSGSNNPDSATTNYDGFPLVLTGSGALTPAAEQALIDLGIEQVLIPGGTAAVGSAVETAITGMGITVKRFAGADRTETAALVASFETATCSDPTAECDNHVGLYWDTSHVNVARGDDFADALAGGPHAGLDPFFACGPGGAFNCFTGQGSPILLTANPSTLGAATGAYLSANRITAANPGGIVQAHIFGGPVAVTTATETAIRNAITG